MKSKTITTTRSFLQAFPLYMVVSLFLFFEMAVQVSPGVMAFNLMHDLQIGAFGLGVMSGCYFYTYTLMQVPSGMLFDHFNPRGVICCSLLVCALGCLLLASAHGFWMACLARLLTGLGSAFAFVSVLVVTKDLFHSRYFATLTGVTQMLAAFGAMSGQLPVSLLVNHVGWRLTLSLFAMIGILISLGVFYCLRYERTQHKAHSPAAAGNKRPWLLGLKPILRNGQTWVIALYACLLWAPMSGFGSLWGVPFLVAVDGFSKAQAAFLVSLMWLGLALASPLLGYVSTVFNNRRWPLVAAALLGTIAFAWVLWLPMPGWLLALLLIFSGAACAGQALSFTLVKENTPPNAVATAIAINNMAVVISGAIFQPLIGWVLHLHVGSRSVATHYHASLTMVLVAYAIAFLIALGFIREPRRLSD